MDLRIVREGQWLHVVVPIALVLLHVVPETLHQRAIEPVGLPIRLGVVGRREVMPHPQEGAYRVEEFRSELRAIVG